MAWASSRYYFGEEPSIFPLTTTRRVGQVTPQPLKEFHTQIAGCAEVAGCSVKDKMVKLTAKQAQYWIDQGVLGEAAGEHHAGAALGIAEKKQK